MKNRTGLRTGFLVGTLLLTCSSAFGHLAKVHKHVKLGATTAVLNGDVHRYRAYEIELGLVLVQKHFAGPSGQKSDLLISHWNESYPTAQKIFGPGANSLFLRLSIGALHNALYDDSSLNTERSLVNTGENFLNWIDHGWHGGAPRVYNYAISADTGTFRFAPYDHYRFKDMLSKHSVHANAQPVVVYAGSFTIVRRGLAKIMVIDNSSGTYAPAKDRLPRLKALMQDAFPGLLVVAKSFDSEVQEAELVKAAAEL